MNDVEKCLQIVTALEINSYCIEAQKKITDKTNEIPIVQEMLDVIDIKDAVVTMDAMHCQKITGRKITQKGKVTVEKSYYISNLTDKPEKLLNYTRNY